MDETQKPTKESGVGLIAKERQKQIEEKGFSIEMDQRYDKGELAGVAICYASATIAAKHPNLFYKIFDYFWPKDWSETWWQPNPDNRLEELAKAGACIAAEMDRLINLKPEAHENP